jgi:hypothetical protein
MSKEENTQGYFVVTEYNSLEKHHLILLKSPSGGIEYSSRRGFHAFFRCLFATD